MSLDVHDQFGIFTSIMASVIVKNTAILIIKLKDPWNILLGR